MITHDTENPPALSSLALGIVHDVQSLVRQQLALFQNELKRDFHQARAATVILLCGAGVALVSLILVGVAAALFIHEAQPAWGLGICFGIPAFAFAVVAGLLLWVGKDKLTSVQPLASDSVEAMKENMQWMTKGPTK